MSILLFQALSVVSDRNVFHTLNRMLFGVDVDLLKNIFIDIAKEKKLGYYDDVLEECVARLTGYIIGHLQKAMNEAAVKLNME